MAALSLMTIAPLMFPLAPSAGEKVTPSVQVAPAFRFRLAVQGFAPLPVAEKSPVVAIVASVTAEVLPFLMASVLAPLVVPAACGAKASVAGVKVSGGVLPPDPVPESATSCGENPAPSVSVTAPLMLPFVVGVKVTARLHLALGASDAPQVVPAELTA